MIKRFRHEMEFFRDDDFDDVTCLMLQGRTIGVTVDDSSYDEEVRSIRKLNKQHKVSGPLKILFVTTSMTIICLGRASLSEDFV